MTIVVKERLERQLRDVEELITQITQVSERLRCAADGAMQAIEERMANGRG